MTTTRIRAAIRLLYPDEMTPTAKRVLEKVLDDIDHEAAADVAAFDLSEGGQGVLQTMALAIGETFGRPELDWSDEAQAALDAHRSHTTRDAK